ncbi:MAG TPA: phosphatidate cytidylyltransferase [Ktedonobacterales bacterium]|jgi:phosphatidate cytidylyltransferase
MQRDTADAPSAPDEPESPDASGPAGARARRRATTEWLLNLGLRVRTAMLLIPVVIALAWFGGWVAFAGALLVTLVALWELRALFARRGWHPIIVLSAAACASFLAASELPQQRTLIVGLSISALIAGSFTWLILSRKATLDGSLLDWALTVVLPFYLGWPFAYFLLLRGGVPGYTSAGFWWTLTALFTVWSFDSAAYFTGYLAGRFFTRHQLAPVISPQKSWEGVAGGMVLALVAAWVFTRPIAVPWYHALIIGVLVSIAATIGDLAESLLKRDIGAKDSGTIIQGHGGILDRADSLLFAILVVYFYAYFLGMVH